MWNEDLVEEAMKILGNKEEMKDVVEVYGLVKRLTDRINEVEDEEKREALLYSTFNYLSENTDVDHFKVISILEVVKHRLVKEYYRFSDWFKERLFRRISGD